LAILTPLSPRGAKNFALSEKSNSNLPDMERKTDRKDIHCFESEGSVLRAYSNWTTMLSD
jgi:hypothetical protein